MLWQEIIYNLLLFAITLLAFLRYRKTSQFRVLLVGALIFTVIALFLATALAPGMFGVLRLLCWTVFIQVPVALVMTWVMVKDKRWVRQTALVLIGLLVICGIDAFFIEPHWLEVERFAIPHKLIKKPIKIAVMADLQTDEVGDFEREVLETVLAEKPDMIFLPGDFIQSVDLQSWEKEIANLNALLKELDFKAPMGVYAVDGNCDPDGWQAAFADLPVLCYDNRSTERRGDIYITGLGLYNSFNTEIEIDRPADSSFHIVFGHAPDFALGHVDADLLIAGHVHGGQVQIPFFGPLITLSRVPRDWAEGLTELGWAKSLVVSRGVGMERHYAPRMRFWCRPQVVIIELEPFE